MVHNYQQNGLEELNARGLLHGERTLQEDSPLAVRSFFRAPVLSLCSYYTAPIQSDAGRRKKGTGKMQVVILS